MNKEILSGGDRKLHVKVKTARGRKNSSARWLQRQLNDPYVSLAKTKGYRSRAAFKLMEIDQKFNLLKKNSKIVDLGAAPGGWSQICIEKAGKDNVIGIDLLEIEPIEGAIFIQDDFTDDLAVEKLHQILDNNKVDVVLSDMAASACGHKQTDHMKIIMLCELAYHFAIENLNIGGHFAAKILQGGTEKELLDNMKRNFKTVKHFKPKSSRKDSSEMYVVAKEFLG